MSGRVFLLGDDIDTDQLAPSRYMKGGLDQLAAHCLGDTYPGFAQLVKPGDIVVAGRNFGMGSSREQAAEALKHLGVEAVVAYSFAGIFYRNAINLGLPVMVAHDLESVGDGDSADIDIETGEMRLTDRNLKLRLEPLPDNLKRILADDGLVQHLKKKFAAKRSKGAGS